MIEIIYTLQELDEKLHGAIPFDVSCSVCGGVLMPDQLVAPDKEGNIAHKECT